MFYVIAIVTESLNVE